MPESGIEAVSPTPVNVRNCQIKYARLLKYYRNYNFIDFQLHTFVALGYYVKVTVLKKTVFTYKNNYCFCHKMLQFYFTNTKINKLHNLLTITTI